MKGQGASGTIKTLINQAISALKGDKHHGNKGHGHKQQRFSGGSSVTKKVEREISKKRKKGGRP